MEWLTCVRSAIAYMEAHLRDDISLQDVAAHVYVSPFFLQRGFSLTTGYGLGEYLRDRRLHEAARDLRETDDRVIDVALRYGYDTPEGFAKAFARFHGATPSQVRAGQAAAKTFLPLTVEITVQGGSQMDYRVTGMFPFRVIGFQRVFDNDTAYQEIPKFWDEICEKHAANIYAGNPPANAWEQAIVDNCIGEYGVCVDDVGDGRFRYLIAGKYAGGEVPEGMALYEFPQGEWAVFDCVGPIPESLQRLNTRIFREWLPGNPDFEFRGEANVEWYDCVNGEKTDPDYHSAIWIPVKRRGE